MERIGRYEVLDELARGGMGAVYRGRDPVDGRKVAIKLMLAPERSWKRFHQEARALAKVDHPGVVRVLDHDVASRERPYLVMELVEGESLAERLRRGGPLPPARAAELAIKLCAAVAACHRAGVLHRDLKPDNVLLTGGDAVKLTDFGLVLDTDPDLSSSRLTAEGNPLGSPTYWAPEQAGGKLDQISERTDVYGLGGTLYSMLTGAEPHQGKTLMQLLSSVQEPKPAPSSFNPEVPAWLDRAVLRALAQEPRARFGSAEELATALASGLAARPSSRGLLLALAAAGGLFGLGLGVAWRAPAGSLPPPPGAAPSLAPSQGVDTPGAAAADHFARGSELAEAERWGEARDCFLAAIALDPTLHRAYGGLSVAEFKLGELQGSLDAANHALRLAPDYRPGYQVRAQVWLALGDPHRAQENAEVWLRLQPDDPGPHFTLALVHEANGDFVEAAQALETSRKLGNTWAGLDLRLGRLYGKARRYERAIRAFERVLARDPQHANAQQLLERARADQAALYRQLDDLAQQGARALNAERWSEAERLFSEMLTLRPWLAQALVNRAKARNMGGDSRGGLADCEVALELDPQSAVAYLNRGACLASLNELERAIADFERALELDPDLENAQRNLQIARLSLRQQRKRH